MPEMIPNKSKSKLPLIAGVGFLVVLIYFAVVVYSKRSSENDSQSAQNGTSATEENVNNSTNQTSNSSSSESAESSYKDGTYSATGSYNSPGGREEIAVTLTLSNGVITSSSVKGESSSPASTQFQKEFINNYKQYVTGKSIANLKLSKVAGSSLTPAGFNAALEKIKSQANS